MYISPQFLYSYVTLAGQSILTFSKTTIMLHLGSIPFELLLLFTLDNIIMLRFSMIDANKFHLLEYNGHQSFFTEGCFCHLCKSVKSVKIVLGGHVPRCLIEVLCSDSMQDLKQQIGNCCHKAILYNVFSVQCNSELHLSTKVSIGLLFSPSFSLI